MSIQKEPVVVKVVLVGESAVGKTCVAVRYARNTYSENTIITLGANFITKNLEVSGHKMKFLVWDTAGQERYRALTRMYYRGAHGALIFYSITSRASFKVIEDWVDDLRTKAPEEVCIIIVGNKADMEARRQVSTEEGMKCAERLGVPFFEVSAKDGTRIPELFSKLGELIVEKFPEIFEEAEGEPEVDLDTIRLEETRNTNNECC